jgi:outer membrane biosynthesis protein TonB
VVDKPFEWSRGISPPQIGDLDPETEKSAPVMHAEIDEPLWANTSRREIVMWSLAAVGAIILGVIPALWINRWREPDPVAQPQASATVDDQRAAEPDIEIDPAIPTPEPATNIERPRAKAKFKPAAVKAGKHRARPERVKQPPPPPPRERKPSPTCNVYLHPKGCPR